MDATSIGIPAANGLAKLPIWKKIARRLWQSPPKLRVQCARVEFPKSSEVDECWLKLPLNFAQDGDELLVIRDLKLIIAYEDDIEGIVPFAECEVREKPRHESFEIGFSLKPFESRSLVVYARLHSTEISQINSLKLNMSLLVDGHEPTWKRRWRHRVLSFDANGSRFLTRYVSRAAWYDPKAPHGWELAQGGHIES